MFENNYLVFFTWRNVNLFSKKVNVNGKLGGSLCRVSSIRCRSSLSFFKSDDIAFPFGILTACDTRIANL